VSLPFFYIEKYDPTRNSLVLDEDVSRHVVQVLRMKKGESINLTDGLGNLLTALIIDENKKQCTVEIVESHHEPRTNRVVSIAISLLKNANRFEWFLEKATELGVTEIVPLICARTEKEKFRYDRMLQICISAMLQSQQAWLPQLSKPVEFAELAGTAIENMNLLIAHCAEGEKKSIPEVRAAGFASSRILIGPEGDFTANEISLASKHGYTAVSLGETRLRTETAGVAAAVLLQSQEPGH
jgi:16S rRNA (uracil1498-N3)-methyltransferase